MGWCVCSCHTQGLCVFTWSSKYWGGKLGLGTGMKVLLDPSKYSSWIILWICSLTYYLICRGVNFTLVLQEFLWSIFLMNDLKTDSKLLGMLEVPKQGYQHVFNWNTLGGMAVHWEIIHCNSSPRWPEKKQPSPHSPFFWAPRSAEKGVCCQLNNPQQKFLKTLFFANSWFFSAFLNIKLPPKITLPEISCNKSEIPFPLYLQIRKHIFLFYTVKNLFILISVSICLPALHHTETSFSFSTIFTSKYLEWVQGSVQGLLKKRPSPTTVLTPCKPSSGQNVIKEDALIDASYRKAST